MAAPKWTCDSLDRPELTFHSTPTYNRLTLDLGRPPYEPKLVLSARWPAGLKCHRGWTRRTKHEPINDGQAGLWRCRSSGGALDIVRGRPVGWARIRWMVYRRRWWDLVTHRGHCGVGRTLGSFGRRLWTAEGPSGKQVPNNGARPAGGGHVGHRLVSRCHVLDGNRTYCSSRNRHLLANSAQRLEERAQIRELVVSAYWTLWVRHRTSLLSTPFPPSELIGLRIVAAELIILFTKSALLTSKGDQLIP